MSHDSCLLILWPDIRILQIIWCGVIDTVSVLLHLMANHIFGMQAQLVVGMRLSTTGVGKQVA